MRLYLLDFITFFAGFSHVDLLGLADLIQHLLVSVEVVLEPEGELLHALGHFEHVSLDNFLLLLVVGLVLVKVYFTASFLCLVPFLRVFDLYKGSQGLSQSDLD